MVEPNIQSDSESHADVGWISANQREIFGSKTVLRGI